MGLLDKIQAIEKQKNEEDQISYTCDVCGSLLIDNTFYPKNSSRKGGSYDCVKCNKIKIML